MRSRPARSVHVVVNPVWAQRYPSLTLRERPSLVDLADPDEEVIVAVVAGVRQLQQRGSDDVEILAGSGAPVNVSTSARSASRVSLR